MGIGACQAGRESHVERKAFVLSKTRVGMRYKLRLGIRLGVREVLRERRGVLLVWRKGMRVNDDCVGMRVVRVHSQTRTTNETLYLQQNTLYHNNKKETKSLLAVKKDGRRVETSKKRVLSVLSRK